MKTRCLKLTLLGLLLVSMISPVVAGAASSEVDKKVVVHNQCLTPSMVQLNNNLRKLWTDHVVWTRNYIVSAVAGMEDQEKVLARLLQNQQDLGNAIKPFYGEAAGNKLAGLLREHILIAGKIVAAAKTGNQADVAKFSKDFYKNADEIVQFLSSANPNWSKKELKELLYTHLQLVTEAAVTRIGKDWDADIRTFDKAENHILKMADVLSAGIIKQFPAQFK